MTMRKSTASRGVSMMQYVLIGSLVGVLSIPLLMTMGNKVGINLFGAVKQDMMHTISPPGNGSSVLGNTELTNAYQGPYQTFYDPQTGRLTVILPESLGGGAITTSADDGGTLAIARLMERYANSISDPQMRDQLLNLSRLGYQMASEQRASNAYNQAHCPTQMNCANTYGLLHTSRDYTNMYNRVMANLHNSGNTEAMQVIQGYSGAIHTINQAHYIGGVAITTTGNQADVQDGQVNGLQNAAANLLADINRWSPPPHRTGSPGALANAPSNTQLAASQIQSQGY